MRGLTKAELIAERDRAERERDLLQLALLCARHEKPEATEIMREDYGQPSATKATDHDYVFELYRADGPIGGILLVTFRCRNQRPTVRAHYWCEYERLATHPFFVKVAIERLRATIQNRREAKKAVSA